MTTSITLKSLKDGMKKTNEEQGLRKLGSCDMVMGVKTGNKCYSVTFSGFECVGVNEVGEDDLRDLDFYIDMPKKDWTAFLESQATEHPTTLNQMDLNDAVVKSKDARHKLEFTRYHRTVQHFFRCVAA